MGRDLGDKLGPRFADLAARAVVAARRDLSPLDAKIRQVATQALIDRAGHEVADLWRPIVRLALDDPGSTMHPVMVRHLERVSSGKHQWEAISGHLQMGAASGLSTVITNYLWPATAGLNMVNRNIPLDVQSGAQAVAAGLASEGEGDHLAALWGTTSDAFALSVKLAQSIPAPDQLGDMVNRGFITEGEASSWMQRGAIPAELHAAIAGLRRLLLSPADAALAVLRGDISTDEGKQIAAASGMTGSDFEIFISNTGEPLGLEQLMEAERRGFIDAARFERGFRQSRYRDEWLDVAQALKVEPMSTADAIDAAVQGHLSIAAAQAKAIQNGLEPGDFQPLYDTAGEPLSRTEMEELFNRGLVTEADVKQALRESRIKDKYIDDAFNLHERLPEGRQVVSMITHSAVTKQQGLDLLLQLGYSKEIAGYLIAEGTNTKTGAHKDLTVSEIKSLYDAGVFTAAHAGELLGVLGYDAADAGFIIKSWDLLLAASITKQAIGVVRSRYVARKYDARQAGLYLDSLGVAGTARDRYLQIWDIEREATIRSLTEAQIVKAHTDSLITGLDAHTRLLALGYDDGDANILLGVAPGAAIPA